MEDSENSRFDDGDDEGGNTDSYAGDAPVGLGWGSAGREYTSADPDRGGFGTSADRGDDDRSRQPEAQDRLHVPAAAELVISEFLGDPFDLHYGARLNIAAEGFELTGGRAAAEPGGWADTGLEGGAALLEHYGIDAHVEHGDLSSLDRYLHEGRSIILAVDADELYGVDDDAAKDDRRAEHALVLSRIDQEAGVAVLQDPANPFGDGYEVSLAALEDAWADSANGMVVTDVAGPDLGEATGTTPSDGPTARADAQAERIRAWGPAGAVVLPILLGGRALIRRRSRA